MWVTALHSDSYVGITTSRDIAIPPPLLSHRVHRSDGSCRPGWEIRCPATSCSRNARVMSTNTQSGMHLSREGASCTHLRCVDASSFVVRLLSLGFCRRCFIVVTFAVVCCCFVIVSSRLHFDIRVASTRGFLLLKRGSR